MNRVDKIVIAAVAVVWAVDIEAVHPKTRY
jgi:hypothetical protein